MKREDDQQLWDLLGQAVEPKLSPFFARNVLRQIRQEPRWVERALSWLRLRRLVPASGLALVVIAAIIFAHNPALRQKPATLQPDTVAKIQAEDYEVAAGLEGALASAENNFWQ